MLMEYVRGNSNIKISEKELARLAYNEYREHFGNVKKPFTKLKAYEKAAWRDIADGIVSDLWIRWRKG